MNYKKVAFRLFIVIFIGVLLLVNFGLNSYANDNDASNPANAAYWANLAKRADDKFFDTDFKSSLGEHLQKGDNPQSRVGEYCIEQNKENGWQKYFTLVGVVDIYANNTMSYYGVGKSGTQAVDESWKNMAFLSYNSISVQETEDYKYDFKILIQALTHYNLNTFIKDLSGGVMDTHTTDVLKSGEMDDMITSLKNRFSSTPKSLRARFLFLNADQGQGHIIFSAREERNKFGDLRIEKKDDKGLKELSGVQFKLQQKINGKYEWISVSGNVNDEKTITAVSKEKASTFTTNTAGVKTIKKLPEGEYRVVEIYNPGWTYEHYPTTEQKDVTIVADKTRTVTIKQTNHSFSTSLEIYKVSTDPYLETNINGITDALANVEVKIQMLEDKDGNKKKESESWLKRIELEPHGLGDVNDDGVINDNDADSIEDLIGKKPLSNKRADINGDGEVTSEDVVLVQQSISEFLNEIEPNGLGDVNDDGKIDLEDVKLILKICVGEYSGKLSEEEARNRSDINQDGNVQSYDALLLLKYIQNKKEEIAPHGLGDINDDGVITKDDATTILSIVTGGYSGKLSEEEAKRRSDINQDGNVTVSDALELLKYVNENESNIQIKPYGLGDVNNDGFISKEDATTILKLVVGTYSEKLPEEEARKRSDINQDGEVTVADSLALLKYINSETTIFTPNGLGDVNDDGKIDAEDAKEIYAICVNKYTGSLSEEEKLERADANQDGIIDSNDALIILEFFYERSSQMKPYGLGDVNEDGAIDTKDALAILRGVVTDGFSYYDYYRCDTNKDGLIRPDDGNAILRYINSMTAIKPHDRGDVNDDGIIDNDDIINIFSLMLGTYSGPLSKEEAEKRAGNLYYTNTEGEELLTVDDALFLLNYLKINEYKIQPNGFGDVNDDGFINKDDALTILKLVVGGYSGELSEQEARNRADINRDSEITVLDALELLKYTNENISDSDENADTSVPIGLGDVNDDGIISKEDATTILKLVAGGYSGKLSEQEARLRADIDQDGKVTVSDALIILKYVNKNGVEVEAHGLGDLNDDGIITRDDATTILKLVVGGYSGTLPETEARKRADIDQDGSVTVSDALTLLKYVVSANSDIRPHGLGDINDNGIIDKKDATTILSIVVGGYSEEFPIEEAKKRSDIDCDGNITVLDALTLLKYVEENKPQITSNGLGDLNDDGIINKDDATTVLSMAVGIKYSGSLSETEAKTRADIDRDGDITVLDALEILKYINGDNDGTETSQISNISSISNDAVAMMSNSNNTQTVANTKEKVYCYMYTTFENATTFKTNEDGRIIIKNIELGKYKIKEIKNPNYGYVHNPGTDTLVGRSDEQSKPIEKTVDLLKETTDPVKIEMDNSVQRANLKIVKRDKDSGTPIPNTEFVIAKKQNGNILWLKQSAQNTGKVWDYTDSMEQAEQFLTDQNGEIDVRDLIVDSNAEYWTYEIQANEDLGYDLDPELSTQGKKLDVKVKKDKNEEATYVATINTLTNRRKWIRLQGYVWEDKSWYNGKEPVPANSLYDKELANGDWEDKVSHVQVRLIDKDTGSVVNRAEYYNEQGILYEEKYSISQENHQQNGIKTGEQGRWEIRKVEIDNLENYYIEFTYNGIVYKTVDVVKDNNNPFNIDTSYSEYGNRIYSNPENGNKSAEGQAREDFNEKYETIKQDGSYSNNGSDKEYSLKYKRNEEEGESILLYRADGDESKFNYGYERNTEPVSGVDDQFLITSNTLDGMGDTLGLFGDPDYLRRNNMLLIDELNLGIIKREKPDMSLRKGLHSVQVTVNNDQNIYKYEQLQSEDEDVEKQIEEVNKNTSLTDEQREEQLKELEKKYSAPQVSFQRDNGKYTRFLYPSDIALIDSNALNVNVTYEIKLVNQASTLKTVINEIREMYTDKYELVNAGTQIDNKGNITNPISRENIKEQDNLYEGFKIATIPTNIITEAQKDENNVLYVQFKVQPNHIKDILGDEQTRDSLDLENIAEISSYSVKDSNGNTYAGIDKDSQPGNAEPKFDNEGYPEFWEDDTHMARGLRLKLQEDRKITGTVFLDDEGVQAEITPGTIRQGDGTYNTAKEHGLEGVEVQVIRAVDANNENAKADKKTTTDQNGNFEITGLLPGNYVLRYIWGDKTYRVQDYKGTVVDQGVWDKKANTTDPYNKDKEWYKDDFVNENEGGQRKSDAIDNLTRRIDIDRQVRTTNYGSKQYVDDKYNNETESNNTITKLYSDTKEFRVNIEYNYDNSEKIGENGLKTETSISDEYELNPDGTIKTDNEGNPIKKPEFENHIKNIDFGIIERAKQQLKLENQIEKIIVATEYGNEILVVERNEEGELQVITKGVSQSPQIDFYVDPEILQASKLRMEYSLIVSNQSEIDYANDEFYWYGIEPENKADSVVKLKANRIIDYYLSEDIKTSIENSGEEGIWIVEDEQIKQKNLTNDRLDGKELNIDKLINDYIVGAHDDVIQEGPYLIKDIKYSNKDNNDSNDFGNFGAGAYSVAYTDELGNDDHYLAPSNLNIEGLKQEESIPLILTKSMSNEDYGNIRNSAEIMEVERQNDFGGSTLVTTPGNVLNDLYMYNGTRESNHEIDDSTASPELVITPVYGSQEHRNTFIYTIVAICSLAVIITGIVLIKKYVLKKKE